MSWFLCSAYGINIQNLIACQLFDLCLFFETMLAIFCLKLLYRTIQRTQGGGFHDSYAWSWVVFDYKNLYCRLYLLVAVNERQDAGQVLEWRFLSKPSIHPHTMTDRRLKSLDKPEL